MCGIAGIINLDGSPARTENLQAALSAMSHRGPDGNGYFCQNNLAFGHTRLSVIDLDGGKQPMHTASGRTVITYNGEIYNFQKLRKSLCHQGVHFRSSSDTEVLANLFEFRGRNCLTELNGMFAFAAVDARTHNLLLARDRLGQKPLVYFHTPKIFGFASEIAALRLLPGCPGEMDQQALHDYLTFQYIPAPNTIYKNVYKLSPGHFLEIDIEKMIVGLPRPYWNPAMLVTPHCEMSFEDAAKKLRRLLNNAVERRLIADVPLGAFLSGGVDSACIAAIMREVADTQPQTFTIAFPEKAYDESAAANAAAIHIGTRHQEKTANLDNIQLLEQIIARHGEPFADSSILPTALVSSFAREFVTVALSGDGADELLGGYHRYHAMDKLEKLNRLPESLLQFIGKIAATFTPRAEDERSPAGRFLRSAQLLATDKVHRYLSLLTRFPEKDKFKIYGERMLAQKFADPVRVLEKHLQWISTKFTGGDRAARLDLLTYLHSDILTKVDQASMNCSLEVRSPFLDPQLVEFALSLPWHFKQDGTTRKKILLHACSDILPPQTAARPKMGFAVPMAKWFRQNWRPLLDSHVLNGLATKNGFFQKKNLQEMINRHLNGKQDYSFPLFSILVFEIWLQNSN